MSDPIKTNGNVTADTIRSAILEWLKPALKRAAWVDLQLTDETSLVASGLLDSFEFLELMAHLEQRLHLEVDLYDVDPAQFTRIGGLVEVFSHARASEHASD